MSDDARQRVPVPADIELPDKLVAGLTARQTVITAVAVLVIWAGFEATRTLMPLPVFAALAAPVAVAAAALAIGQRDGLTLDRLLAAAWRQARSPRRMVAAPEGVPAVPDWVAPGLARQAGPPPAVVTPPWQALAPDGVIGLGDDGAAAVCAVSTINFALRSPAEQEALTAAYGRWLHSLTGPAQILIRTGRADLATAITRLREDAPALPHPALEHAALGHAAFLAALGASRQVLTRQVLLVTREPGRAAPGRPGGAAGRAAQRAAEAARLLAAADLQARPLDGAQVTALLSAACDPGGPHRAQRLAPPGPIAQGSPGIRAAAPSRPGTPAAVRDGLPVPPAVEVAARHVVIDGDYAATLAVTGYPAEVAPGWLEPLTSYPGRLDIALHIEPVPPAVAADRLRRQRARLESSRRTWAGQGRLDDPETEAAAEDARALAYQVARGEGKLFRLGLYLTVHGEDPEDLAGQVAGVRALADSLLLSTAPATYRSLQGWVTTLPAGTDALKIRRTMDTAALAAAFPFSSPDLPRDPAAPDPLPGVLYGASASGPGLVAWDRWAAGQPQLRHPRHLRRRQELPGETGDLPAAVHRHRMLGRRPRRRVREAVRGAGRRLHPPRRARGAPEPVRPARPGAGTAGRADPPRPVHPHRDRGADRRRPVPGGESGAGQGDHGRLPPRRDQHGPADLGAARPFAGRPGRRAARRRHPARRHPRRPARALHRGHPLGAVLRADHHPPRRAPGRLLAAGPARGAQGDRHAAGAGRDLAAGLRPRRPGTAAADHRR